jgi:hypothetical protein
MLINNITVSDRNTDPPVLSKVGLRLFFLQDGDYFDPYQISSVSIFKASDNYSPSTVLNTDELIASSVSSNILMNFRNSSPLTSHSSFDPSNFTGSGESGIYRLNKGDYAVILDGINNQQGYLNLFGINQTIPNSVSNIGDYMDVWTVKMVAGSELETVFNYFTLTTGNFQTVTEPLMFRVRNRLLNNSIVLGSKVDIKINSEITVESPITEETKNTLKNYIVRNASIEIVKLNNETNLPARVTVSSFADTSSLTKIANNNLISFTWDTELLKTHPQAFAGNLAGIKGTYYVQAKFNLFNERIISPPMHLTVE